MLRPLRPENRAEPVADGRQVGGEGESDLHTAQKNKYRTFVKDAARPYQGRRAEREEPS